MREDQERLGGQALHHGFGYLVGLNRTLGEHHGAGGVVSPGEQQQDLDLEPGDVLLACEFVTDKGDAVRKDIGSVTALRDLWNDRELGGYDRAQARWKCWVARGSFVYVVELRANRLFW